MFSSSGSSPLESGWPSDKKEDVNARTRITALVMFVLLFGVVLLAIVVYVAMMAAADSRGQHTDEEIIGSKSLGGGRSPSVQSTGSNVRRAVTKERTAVTTARLTTTPRPNGADVAARLIKDALNHKYSPCDDFYNFVCSTFSGGDDVFAKLRYQTQQAIKKMLSTMHVPRRFQRATQKAAALYRACVRLTSDRSRDEMDAVRNFLCELELDISDLDDDPNFDIVHKLVYLNFIYGFPTFIRFNTLFGVSGKSILEMTINKEDESWMKDSHERFSGPALEVFYAKYLFTYDSELDVEGIIKDIIRLELVVMDFIKILRRQLRFLPLIGTVGRLGRFTKGYVSNEYWVRLIEMATSKRITATNIIDIRNNATALLVLLLDKKRMARSDSRLLIAWSLVRQLVPLASGRLMGWEAQKRFPDDPYRVSRLCYEYVIGVMPLAASQRFVSSYLRPSALASIRQLTENVMGTLMKKLNETDWIQGNLLCMMYEKALQLRLMVVYPEAVGTEAMLENFFFDIPDIGEGFIVPYLAARRLMTMNTFRNSVNVSFDTARVNAVYQPNQAKINILAGILQPPVFIPGAPASFNYGTLGQVVAHEVMHAFDVEGIKTNTRLKQVSLENTTAKHMYTSKLLCLRSSYMQAESESRGRSLDVMTDSEGFVDVAGIQLSYAAYQSLPDAERSATVRDVGLTSKQTFFVSHCLKWCTAVPGTRRDPEGYYWHSRSRCIVPLRNMREFADAFSCKPGDRMNPSNKCSFW